jgi:hypothetical protein
MRTLLLAAGLLALPLNAGAVLINVDYTGRVTTDNGLGLPNGTTVAGTLTYDTNLLGADLDLSPSVSTYGLGQFVSGYVPSGAPGFGKDHLYFFDQAYGGFLDRFEIGDAVEYAEDDGAGTTYNLQQEIGITALASDALQNFIVGDSVFQPFTLTAADDLADFSAFLSRQEIRTVNHETTLVAFQFAVVSLDRLSVSAVAVPEPGTLMLLSFGLAALRLTRRRR